MSAGGAEYRLDNLFAMHNHSGLFLNYVAECGVIHQNFGMAWLLDTLFAILVSPSISPGEKAVMRNAFDRGYPLIILQENGSADLAKPGGRRMDACAEGRLLTTCTMAAP